MRYTFIIILLFILSCEHHDEDTGVALTKVEEITFEAPGFVSINPPLIQLIESDSGDYIFVYNHIAKNFQFIEFPTGKLVHEVPLHFEGPNNVQRFSGGTLTNLDSIWFTFAPLGIGLMNFDGEVIFKRKIENDLFRITSLGTDSSMPLYQDGSKIFGGQPYFMNHHGMGREDIRNHQLVYSYDFRIDSAQWYDIFYPDNYWDLGKKLTDYSWAEREGKIYIAPLYDHEMQVFDMSTGKVTLRKQVKSTAIERFNYVNEMPTGMSGEVYQRAAINALKFDRYGMLLFDQYRDVFYRIFIPGFEPAEDTSIENLGLLNRSRSHWGIMVLDKDLKLLKEHIFDDFEAYPHSNFLVGKKGLYVSKNNLFNADYNEDNFRYMILKLER